ncbi:hypothetical protein WBG99_20505 [Streptomyces sp. TG1A-60]|uniref:hypothetical protein n=1 Tax=Streptomyces sp. TG1A-60 TaxID=3129111 RepID=UPI0030D1EAD9
MHPVLGGEVVEREELVGLASSTTSWTTDSLLYTAQVRTGVDPIPVEEYRQTGRAWVHAGT